MRKYLPGWLNKLIPTFFVERLTRREVDQLKLSPFLKWEGLFVVWGPRSEEETGRLLFVSVVDEPSAPAV